MVAARNRDKNDTAVAELSSLGARAMAIAVDVSDEDSVNALIRTAAGL